MFTNTSHKKHVNPCIGRGTRPITLLGRRRRWPSHHSGLDPSTKASIGQHVSELTGGQLQYDLLPTKTAWEEGL